MSLKTLLAAIVLVVFLSVGAQAVIVETSFGSGADTWLRNDQGAQGSNYGTQTRMELRKHSAPRCRIPYFRFDLSGITGGDLTDAQIAVDMYDKGTGSVIAWSVYGLINDATNDAWGETTINYNNAPGFSPTTPEGNYDIDPTELTYLGTMTYPGGSYKGIVTSNTTDLDLDSFLAADDNYLVTFVLLDETGSEKEWYLSTKEREAADPDFSAPELILPNAVPEPTTIALLGLGALIFVRRKHS